MLYIDHRQSTSKLVPFLELVVSSASIFTIMTISIERYRVVCYPLSVSKEKVRQFIRMVVVIWILALLTSAPILPIIVFKESRLKDGTPIQVCRIPVRKDWHKAYFIINSIIIYFVPCVVLSALYVKLCRTLVQTKYIDDTTIELQNHTRNDKLRLRWQVINIIATIVCVFFICHLPYRVVSIWMMLENNKKLSRMGLETYLNILYSARLLLYFNHALNPILYNFVSTKFRNALRHLLYSKRRNRSSFLYDRRKSPDVIKQKTRFKQNCIPLKEQSLIRDKDCKSSSTDSRGKMNDFSPLYANVCDTDNQKVVCAKEISHKSVEKEEMNFPLSTPTIIMNIRTSTSPVLRLKLETKEGYVFGITVEKLRDNELKKENLS